MSNDECRKAFEKWADSHSDINVRYTGRYSAWLTWQYLMDTRAAPEPSAFEPPNVSTKPEKMDTSAKRGQGMNTSPATQQPDEKSYSWPKGCNWPNKPFTFHSEPGEHDPCYVIMPGGEMLSLNHYNDADTDITRAQFIIAACNYYIQPPEREAGCQKCDLEMERVKACEHIAEGDMEGNDWRILRNICPSTMAVAKLRDEYEIMRDVLTMLSKRQIATWHAVKNADGTPDIGNGYYAGWDDAEYAVRKALAGEDWRRSVMRYEVRDIITENGLCYQVWSIEEAPRPVSCLYTKAAGVG